MKKLTSTLWAVVLTTVISSSALGAIVYTGSQNVVLKLNPMSPMDSQTIQIAGSRENWDDFRIDLWLETDMMGMTMYPMGMMSMGTRLAIYAPGSMGMGMDMMGMMGMGGILGLRTLAGNVPMGGTVAIDSFFDIFLEVTLPDGLGEFGEAGGYLGLRTAMGQYGWLHMLRQSKMGTDAHEVVFDGWAYEEQPGVPVAAGQGAACDRVRGRPHKMHWPQLPDLSMMGVDVGLGRTALADDFKCSATGPITDIHFWGSFRDDALPKEGPGSLKLELSIHSDVPATKDSWSRPGELLWRKTFTKGEYSVRQVHDGPEDWYDLATGAYLPGNHRQAWQYNFCIDKDAFVQTEGTIYWLAVKDLSNDGNYALGWKTTSPKETWNDHAVSLALGGWTALAYPKSHGYAQQALGLSFVITGDDKKSPAYDLGDAPDSSNSIAGANMLAYPSGVLGAYPTVYQAGSPPYGPLHRQPRAQFYLGKWVSLETEADLGIDEDTANNLDPLNDTANQDGSDDGLHLPVVMPLFQTTTVDYDVTSVASQATRAYVNVWCDWNRDGDWDDALVSPSGASAAEWAVQNDAVTLPGPGTYTFTSPAFRCWQPTKEGTEPLWVRVMITETRISPGIVTAGVRGIGGQGLVDGFKYGETEDYYLEPLTEAPAARYDWGDAPEIKNAPGYPTLAASNGARHVPVGPWLGGARDMPDSEADGQPDPNALGDNRSGSDDENGVCIPPLVPGFPESVTVEVNGGGGVVQGWIDLNGDRMWQDSEKIYDGFLPDGVHVLPFSVPNSALPGQTFARFRISREGRLEPTGPAKDGEVEDYEVRIENAPTREKTWCQRPDLTPYGIDIRVDSSDGVPRALADDFQCKIPGQLTHIRLWGSWRDDRKGEIKKIRLRVYDDDPAGPEGYDQKNKFSKPQPEVLWEKEFVIGQFQEALYHTVRIRGEWWWNAASGKGVAGGDTQVWRLDMDVKPEEAFVQSGTPEQPRIYWLAVEVEVSGGEFGWKTRRWPQHFMDDAVWDDAAEVPRTWEELRYPAGHRFFEHEYNSIDMAFCLLFLTDTTPPATSQPVAMTQCPPVETTCPALLTTCPTKETECPTTETKCPPVSTRCPPVLTQCPPTATECQGGQTVCPAVETRCPSVETKCPPLETKCPPAETRCPPASTQCPVTPTQCPPITTQCPPVDTQCPPVDTKCPPVFTQCPETVTRCPPTPTQCESADTQCPEVLTQCPPIPTRCPPGATQCQPVDTQCIQMETECPPIYTYCPPVYTRCPETATQCPPVPTQCPPVDTQCPPEDTRCPPEDTRCPPVLTRCPPTPTLCQPIVTECPSVFTQCPVTLTICTNCLGAGSASEDATPSLAPGPRCPAVETSCATVGEYLATAGGVE